jgi:hypothetical protein
MNRCKLKGQGQNAVQRQAEAFPSLNDASKRVTHPVFNMVVSMKFF